MKTIKLANTNQVALVDDADYDRLSKYKWHCRKENTTTYPRTNIVVNGKPKPVLMHQLLNDWALTDHINGNGLDNQRKNLRPATVQQNNRNARKQEGTTSQYKGVCWRKDKKKWNAYIMVDRKRLHLGYFTDEKEAAKAYDAAAKKHFGDFANFNLS